MAYAPFTWVEKVSKVGPTNLNHLELGLQAAAAVADAAKTEADAALPTPAGSNGQFLKKVGGVWVPTSFAISDIPDPTAGKVVGSSGGVAAAVFPPGFEFAYNEYTASVTVSGTSGAPTSVVSSSGVTYDGTTIVRVEFYSELVTVGSADQVAIELFEDTTSLGILGVISSGGSTTPTSLPICLARRRTPSAGAHGYTVKAWRITNNGTITAGLGGPGVGMPGYIRVTKV